MDELFKDQDLIQRFGGGFQNVKKIEHLLKSSEKCSSGLTIIFSGLNQYKIY